VESDLELVTRLARGDSAAFEAIVYAHQDAVVRFWRNPASFTGGSLRAWLFTVVRNVALNELRGTRRRTARIEKVAPPAQAPDALQHTADAEQLQQVRDFIATLPEQERSALTLYAAEGLSQAEVASVLGTTEGAVKQAILSARKKLRERFEECS
jgi:RNA polymerase sigma factor (sigma-70 family)